MGSSGPSDITEGKLETNAKQKSHVPARRARDRELERKRARGDVSCAECRRLKLKCNKKVPCASCIRRGCHTICPNGLLTTGQGSRFVLANTDKLHSKLLQMSQRIRQLEDALQIVHSSISKMPHPLLSEKLLSIKSGVDTPSDEKEEVELDEEEEEMTTAFGTLAVSEHGETRFVGRVAADTLLVNEPEAPEQYQLYPSRESEIELNLPEALIHASRDFPFSRAHLPKEQLLALIAEHLPTYERATALAEAYLENVAWLPRPIQRDQIMEDLIPLIYKGRRAELTIVQTDECGKYNGVHRMRNLALTLAVFACGAAGDLTLPPHNKEGMLYNYLARAALGSHSIIGDGVSLETVQTITLIAAYDFFSCTRTSLESAWKVLSFGHVLAASIGLHRDPAHWSMESSYMQRRRTVFWENCTLDKWKCLGTGRPSIFRLQEVDCEFPEDEDAVVGSDGKVSEGPYRWRYRFAKEIVGPISEHLCLTRPIKFSEIMEFDRKIRDFENPPMLQNSVSDGVRERMWGLHKDIALLFIHRNFFARAMIKHSGNPLRSPFAPSFLAAYASAIKLLRSVRLCFEQNPQIVLRQWPIWAHCLTSAVIIGSVASKSSQAPLATAAFHDLNLAILLFEDANMHPVAKRGLPILLRLRERASVALQKQSNEIDLIPKSEKDETEELNILRGAARFIRRTNKNKTDGLGSGTLSQRTSSDHSSTPKSDGTSNTSSPLQMVTMDCFAASVRYQQQSFDSTPFASAGMGIPIDPDLATMPPDQPMTSVQSHFSPAKLDFESLLNMVYGDSSNSSNVGATTAPAFNPLSYAQLPNSSPSAQLPQCTYDLTNPQGSGTIDTGSLSTVSNNSWFPETSQLDAMSTNFFGSPPAPFESMLDGNTTTPSYDFEWVSGNGPGDIPEISGDAAQFVADWRFQAAVEGSQFLSDPEIDTRMSF